MSLANLQAEVEQIMHEARTLRDAGRCPGCGERIQFNSFRTAKDVRDHRISGFCQGCIDKFFVEDA